MKTTGQKSHCVILLNFPVKIIFKNFHKTPLRTVAFRNPQHDQMLPPVLLWTLPHNKLDQNKT
ncbi:MAG: hypothetical protein K6U74_21015, partial [Firmicutes bacterium]|nr:hypothetical protein [Bacillota bacterium]